MTDEMPDMIYAIDNAYGCDNHQIWSSAAENHWRDDCCTKYIRADSEVLKRVVGALQFSSHELHDLCDEKELDAVHQALADLKELIK